MNEFFKHISEVHPKRDIQCLFCAYRAVLKNLKRHYYQKHNELISNIFNKNEHNERIQKEKEETFESNHLNAITNFELDDFGNDFKLRI